MPALSVVLATDNFERGRALIESTSRQTIADQIELVLVTTSPDEVRARTADLTGFHSITIVPVDTIVPLAHPRSVGVRASRAQYVFIAETHAYPDADVCERIVDLLNEGWSVVVPGLRNANPLNGISWGGFLSDYGAWSRALPAGQIFRLPAHNAAFRRDVLMEFGDNLEQVFGFGDDLQTGLRSRGHRVWFEPAVSVEHVNIRKTRDWMRERHVSGILIGGARSKNWRWPRRLLYVAASPLIPFVIMSRIRDGIKQVGRHEKLPPGTMPVIVGGLMLKVAGEVRGYLFGADQHSLNAMTDFEVKKLAFNAGEKI